MSNAMHEARNDLPVKVIPCRPGLVTEMQPRPPLRQLRGQSRCRGRARINVAEKPNLAVPAVFSQSHRSLQLRHIQSDEKFAAFIIQRQLWLI